MKKKHIFVLIIVILLMILFLSEKDKNFIVIEDKMENPVAIIPVQDKFSTVYIHSSERQPWENIYKVNDDQTFTLMTMKVRSLGPGVPYNVEEGWKFYIRDGYFVYDNINQKFDYINFKLSSISPHFIEENGKKYNLVDICGDNADIKLLIKKGILVDIRRCLRWIMPRSRGH
ncbi:MAG TPA: DUF1850 domain-containing protein [Thermoanaerobacterales bacterium]|nr:DUF1850 domain-containing protein [Thermoanaerobacterales bacterium]